MELGSQESSGPPPSKRFCRGSTASGLSQETDFDGESRAVYDVPSQEDGFRNSSQYSVVDDGGLSSRGSGMAPPRQRVMLRKSKTIHDRLYGSISLPGLLVAVMDSPEFERLDRIAQLGGSARVYPSARHTRKEHSIGVAYLAGQYVKKLREVQPDLGIDDADELCVMLAGLTHDLGHGPYSHMWETFMKESRPGKWKHEDMSLKLIRRVAARLPLTAYFGGCTEVHARQHVEFTCALIRGLEVNDAFPDDVGRLPSKRFLFDIVSNSRSGVDVDKIDYLNRDALSAFGSGGDAFDWRRLVESLRVLSISQRRDLEICYEGKIVTDINQIFTKRAMMHLQVYQHRVSNNAETLISDMFLAADKSDFRIRNPRDPHHPALTLSQAGDDVDAFIMLTDSIIDDINISNAKGLDEAHRLYLRLQMRDYYTLVDKCARVDDDAGSMSMIS